MRSHANTLLSVNDDDELDDEDLGEDNPLEACPSPPPPRVGMGLTITPPLPPLVGESSRCFDGDPAEEADDATDPGGLAVRGLPGSRLREEGTCASAGVTGASAYGWYLPA